MLGYRGEVLRVNLDPFDRSVVSLRGDWARLYLGAKGLGQRYLFSLLQGKEDPLSSENSVVVMTGPLAGTAVSSAGRASVVTKSPATGTILECSIGGRIGAEIKFAGYDGIVITGACSRPSYLLIADRRVQLRDASHLWGKDTHETEEMIRKELREEDAVVLCIGPAGENCVPFACLTSEKYRQAGRGGAGAVFGAKKLKAIVVIGSTPLAVPDIDQFMAKAKAINNDVLSARNAWAREHGTPILVEMSQAAGILPTHNFQSGQFSGHQAISSEAVQEATVAKHACFGCLLGCGNLVRTERGWVEGPEYETLALAGSNCGIGDLSAVVNFNRQCDALGLDTMSAGSVVALAMELTEKGIADLGVRFGDVDGYLSLPGLIARREGVGAKLALGVRSLAESFGARELALEVKGLEYPGYDPRGSWGMALAYAIADRGACHLRAWPVGKEAYGNLDPFTSEGKAEIVVEDQNMKMVKYSLGLCDFYGADWSILADIVSWVTGQEISVDDVKLTGERIWNLSRLFNVREGFRRSDDTLPPKMTRPLKGGVTDGRYIPPSEFNRMLEDYYRIRGWNENGVPKPEAIERLGFDAEVVAAYRKITGCCGG